MAMTQAARARRQTVAGIFVGELAERLLSVLVAGLPIVAVLIVWEVLSRSGYVSTFLLPSFSSVMERVWTDLLNGEVISNLGFTLYRSLAGFAIASVLGIAIGIMMVQIAPVRWFFDPIVSVGFSLPKIAFLPIFVLWLGLYDASKLTMIVVNAIFPVIIATQAGAQGVDKILIWSARSMGTTRLRLLYEIVLPASLPQILTGLQIALPIALTTCIVSEILLGGNGIGGLMIRASRFADSTGVFAGIVQIAIVGVLTLKVMELFRRRLLSWHQDDR